MKNVTEKEMREFKVPTFNTDKELISFINELVAREHDYGTCVYAMSQGAVAAFNYIARKLGVTGFQASCADMDIIKRTRNYEMFRIINYDNLLYPQYLTEEHFPSINYLLEENKAWLKEQAEKLLAERDFTHPDVLAHWEKLAGRS